MEKAIQLIHESVPNQERANQLMGRLFEATRPNAIFSEPVTQGSYTVITASELSIGMGFGFGGGASVRSEQDEAEEENDGRPGADYGSGGGGGGGAMARPVAAIEIGPSGVRVEPIVDPTKISIAFFTAIGSMFMMLLKMKRAAAGD